MWNNSCQKRTTWPSIRLICLDPHPVAFTMPAPFEFLLGFVQHGDFSVTVASLETIPNLGMGVLRPVPARRGTLRSDKDERHDCLGSSALPSVWKEWAHVWIVER